MAEVFRAAAEGPHGFARAVAVKRVLPRLAATPEFVRMFTDEAKISALLVHPNIVQVFAFAESSGAPLIVMEHVDGLDLGAILRSLSRDGRYIAAPVMAEIARQCCAALDYAHRLTGPDGAQLGIVHRDVTPSNIMITWDGVVKLLDFGIARAVQEMRESETAAGTVKGKVGYLAPEQISKGITDARADIFALGAVMHEGLTGRRLFSERNDLATLMSVLEKSVEPPSRVNPGAGSGLDYIVMRALRRNPRQRFASAADFGTAIEGFLRRTRSSNARLRTFMQEMRPRIAASADRRTPAPVLVVTDQPQSQPQPGPEPHPQTPPPQSQAQGRPPADQTIMLEDVEILGGVVDASQDGAAAAAAAAPPPLPGEATAIPAPPRIPAAPARRTRRVIMLSAGAALLLVLIGGGLASYPRVWGGTRRAATASGGGGDGSGERVTIVLDSTPQGATVARASDGAALGETPLLLELPRGRAPVAFVLRKAGYETRPYKLIPTGVQPAVVKLRRARLAPGPVSAAVAADAIDPE